MMGLRRRVAVGVLLATVLLATPVPSSAASESLNRLVDGAFTGSGTIAFSNPGCGGDSSSIQDYFYGAGEPPSRSGTVHVVVCVDLNVSPFAVRGTFEFVTRTGATLSGVILGTASTSTFHNTYTVTGGTKMFRHAVGTVDAAATYDLNTATNTLSNIQGIYIGSLDHRPRR